MLIGPRAVHSEKWSTSKPEVHVIRALPTAFAMADKMLSLLNPANEATAGGLKSKNAFGGGLD